jgi:hypothetical protein
VQIFEAPETFGSAPLQGIYILPRQIPYRSFACLHITGSNTVPKAAPLLLQYRGKNMHYQANSMAYVTLRQGRGITILMLSV